MQKSRYFQHIAILFLLGLQSCNRNSFPTTEPETSTLFTKYKGNPVFDIGPDSPHWRSIHTANVTVIRSGNDNNYWSLYMRGSGGSGNNYHDQIGLFTQPDSAFVPTGPWQEFSENPVLRPGPPGSSDARHLLDAVALRRSKNELLLYYMSRDDSNNAGLSLASSTDGGRHFEKYGRNALMKHVGPNDAMLFNDQYYLFYGDGKWNGNGFDQPLQIHLSVSSKPTEMNPLPESVLKVGAPGSFDSYSVNGAKIFRVTGDDRWFMLYQCSSRHFDFPERFHCAYSADLKTWTKVKNSRKPLLTRGDDSEFDQGAIWTGSVIEHKGILYIYYEGWGSYKNDAATRNKPYYAGGNSRVGIASCSTRDFLKWVDE